MLKKNQKQQPTNTKDFHRRRPLAEMKGEREHRPAEGAVDIGVAPFVTSDPACVNSPPWLLDAAARWQSGSVKANQKRVLPSSLGISQI